MSLPGGQGYCCYFFTVHYLRTILRFPQSQRTRPSVPGASASRAEAGTVCRSHFRAQLLSWLLHFRQGLMCSGAQELGELQRRGRSQGLGGQRCPRWLPERTGPCLGLLFWARLSGWHRGHLSLLAWAHPSSTGTSTFCVCLTDPSSSIRKGLRRSPFHR